MPGPGSGGPAKLKLGRLSDSIFLDEATFDSKPNQPYIVDLVTFEQLFLQTVPIDIEVSPETSWVAIASAGRNNPLYQYTGAEDTLKFSITFYANTAGKQDAWKKVKWIQALGKNNGYKEKPHPIKFVMGELFKKSKFVLASSNLKISNFDRTKGMMPNICALDIELKRITEENQLRSEMLDINT